MARTRGGGAAHKVYRRRLYHPAEVRVSIGWPKSVATCGAIGECWATEASSDRHAELFISPELTEGARIIDVLAHELVHATVGVSAGHMKPFKQCALKIGLVGPMRSTTAGPEFAAWTVALIERIGPYPAGYLTYSPKQSTRMHKCWCSTCGYVARVSQKWLSLAGPPICPIDRIQMNCGQKDQPEVPARAAAAHRRSAPPANANAQPA